MGAIEKSSCGVGFVASTSGEPRHAYLEQALRALSCVEHRGGCLADGKTGDGAGMMTEVPFDLFGYERGAVAVGTLFIGLNTSGRKRALEVFESVFRFMGIDVLEYRDVAIDTSVLGQTARATMPTIVHVALKRPEFCRTIASFNSLLYRAKQALRTHLRRDGIVGNFFCTSLSTTTIVYKALTSADSLAAFYPDLRSSKFVTRFALFHRRFSTNTRTSWDKAQPFRMIAHNGEINTIQCNRAWAIAREQALGLPKDELLTHENISDSGNLNEVVEALRFRSSIPNLPEALAIMVPPAKAMGASRDFYRFWSRALEPWDGPAFLAYSDGDVVGARLDRNGFRPCRWSQTNDAFYLASEAGIFDLDETQIIAKGLIHGGSGAFVELSTGEVRFDDPSRSRENVNASFDARLEQGGRTAVSSEHHLDQLAFFQFTEEEIDQILVPMIADAKEPIGSMGDTARPAILSDQPRSFFDYFYQDFAQVTNPPLDHLRERLITDLGTYLGRRPNVFAPKTLIPPSPGLELPSPILDLEQMAWLREAAARSPDGRCFETIELRMSFARVRGAGGLRETLEELQRRALAAIQGGCTIIVLTHRMTKLERPPIPSLLALCAVGEVLHRSGHRLDASIVVEAADARTTHHMAALVGFGAAAVCPYMAFEIAPHHRDRRIDTLPSEARAERLKRALEAGLLKVMSKMGISSVLGYQGAKLFTPLGLSQSLLDAYFPGKASVIGGLDLEQLAGRILDETSQAKSGLISTFQLREHARNLVGEKHSMTSRLARIVHALTEASLLERWDLYDELLQAAEESQPVNLRHLLDVRVAEAPIPLEDVQPAAEMFRRFRAGAMSFGAISAEAQRDLINAMRAIGGHSNSGEGGENPYYWIDGTTATTKQVASGRFGVTAEYLMSGQEIEIKVCQGAKPGEGGQLMAVKVDAEIARARYSLPGVDLISPPPLHDVYSIEDLRQLIYELKQLKPGVRVSVKLVSGHNIGAIAAGVVKAGADVIQISGGDGGTGAASISSMKHAGLPWELGLMEVHRTLVEMWLRERVTLRVDGGLLSGRDVVIAALLGAEEFGFGKILLVAEGCIMARVCEKNTCPRGIATHDPRFKEKYRGTKEKIVNYLTYVAEDVRRELAKIGACRIEDIVGKAQLLQPRARHEELIRGRGIDLTAFFEDRPHERGFVISHLAEGVSRFNARMIEDATPVIEGTRPSVRIERSIKSTDRAALATLAGIIAKRTHESRIAALKSGTGEVFRLAPEAIAVELTGSAGQGFGVFLVEGIDVVLRGEANDSVAKSMSGGRIVIRPRVEANYPPEENAIIGNCALYGATGGTLFVDGIAGDRFAVRNSGATAVVEGAGLHACEYMTKGLVAILGRVSHNVGAGMTGGKLYMRAENQAFINADYIAASTLDADDEVELHALLADYAERTDSRTARAILDAWELSRRVFVKLLPRKEAQRNVEGVSVRAAPLSVLDQGSSAARRG
jgi:glutamate synthase domain-containing protein 2/glutamate synthase domain-containing protein 1/glutamate synthase domain-containing protein 3